MYNDFVTKRISMDIADDHSHEWLCWLYTKTMLRRRYH